MWSKLHWAEVWWNGLWWPPKGEAKKGRGPRRRRKMNDDIEYTLQMDDDAVLALLLYDRVN